jgi:HEAT repeat protein
MVRDRLLYGEPVEFLLDTRNASEKGPFVRVRWEEPKRTARVELTTEGGRVVPFTAQALGGYSALEGDHRCVRLWPGGRFARGRYFAPARYRLRVVVEGREADGDGISWAGKLTAGVPFEILPEGAGRASLVPDGRRRQGVALVHDLGVDSFAAREAAEKALIGMRMEAVPLLEEALGSEVPEVKMRARRVLRATLQPLLTEQRGFQGSPLWHEGGPLLTYCGARTWAWVREQFGAGTADMLAAQAAAFGPVDPYRDMTRLDRKEAARLVGRLRAPDAAARVRAVRSLSRTTNEAVQRALVDRLADPYSYWLAGPGDPAPYHPVAAEAREAIAWQGRAAVAPLLAFGRAEEHRAHRAMVARLLGEMAGGARDLEYLAELLATHDPDVCYGAVDALKKLGPAGVPLLLRAARDPGQNDITRRDAILGLGNSADARQVGPFLLKVLRERDRPAWVAAAAEAAGRVRLREAVPALKEIARDEGMDPNARYSALRAIAATGDRREATAVLLGLLDGKVRGAVRGHAMMTLARAGNRDGLPAILAALDDRDGYVRAVADQALRLLAGRPEGVGYDPHNPDARPWRRWWKQERPGR